MQILALDPGTKCGYALSPFESGVWNLSVGRHEGGGMRFFRLRNYLITACEGVDLVVYEEVRRHLGTDAAHIYGGIVAIIQEHCELHEIPYQGVAVGTIKIFGSGKGNSNKEVMLAAARERWAEVTIVDDNQADALFLWAWASNEYNHQI
uniref:Holliday junction resolvase RuvC n=1 Tax=viral metagenome TaxID=1070528 RepID=A0A6H1ZUD6_9ZZZZ